MTKYQAIFEGETSSREELGKKGVLIISLSLDESKNDEKEKLDKFEAGLLRLETVSEELDLVITDVLNRHNYELFSVNEDEAKKKSIENSACWEKKYLTKIKTLSNLKKTHSWSNLIANQKFEFSLSFTKNLYKKDKEFKRRIGRVAGDRLNYLASNVYNYTQDINLDLNQALNKIIDYILEECAVVDLLKKSGYDSLFYLGKISSPIEYMCNLTESENKMKLYSVSQYKVLKNTPNNYSTIRLFKNNEIDYISKPISKKVESNHALKYFFDSPTISEQTKIDVLFKLYNNESSIELGKTQLKSI